jgi:hypothetical protein
MGPPVLPCAEGYEKVFHARQARGPAAVPAKAAPPGAGPSTVLSVASRDEASRQRNVLDEDSVLAQLKEGV